MEPNSSRTADLRMSRYAAVWAVTLTLLLASAASGQSQGQPQSTPAVPPAAAPPAAHVTLDRAIELALQHDHTLLAARSTIDQNKASEITANLRPNPVLSGDAEFLPIFQPSQFSNSYINSIAEFDVGISYTIERGKKRQHRLEAARDQTAVTTATVSDNERTLIANVAQQFIGALLANANLELAQMDLDSFQNTVQISESRYQAGDISQGDLLKIQLQLLQFQMDLSAAQLAKVEALAALRQFVGFEALPENYDVDGALTYQGVPFQLDDWKALALRSRPDLQAATLGVTSAQGQYSLAKADGKRDVDAALNYSHVSGASSASVLLDMQLPIFDRNQGEIARTRFAINQAQETQSAAAEQVLTDVTSAFENLRTDDQIVKLYTSGYLKEAEDSRDISNYAYQQGAASLLDFLDAERSYRATELGYRQAVATYMLALEQMRQAVGTRSLP